MNIKKKDAFLRVRSFVAAVPIFMVVAISIVAVVRLIEAVVMPIESAHGTATPRIVLDGGRMAGDTRTQAVLVPTPTAAATATRATALPAVAPSATPTAAATATPATALPAVTPSATPPGTATATRATALPTGAPCATPTAAATESSPLAGVTLTTPDSVHGALLFDDEFNGTAVDTSKWQVFQDNDQLGGYQNTWDATSVTESGGALHLTAKMLGGVEVSGGMWTQGKVAIQPYGYWEMRARIPAASGTWPAFWAIPYDLNNGAGNDALSVYEIDTMEAIDHCVADRQAISWNTHLRRPDGTDYNPGNASLGTEMYSGYHIYATQWSPGLIVWYVDGVEQFRVADANIPTTRMTAIVQMATGGYQNPLDRAQLPQTMDVDWIRIYANP